MYLEGFSCKLVCNCGYRLQQLIEVYFWEGFQYKVIRKFLQQYHNVEISMRTLRRRLLSYGLRRRNQPSSLMQVWNAIHSELRGPGMNAAIMIIFCFIIKCCIMLRLLQNIACSTVSSTNTVFASVIVCFKLLSTISHLIDTVNTQCHCQYYMFLTQSNWRVG